MIFKLSPRNSINLKIAFDALLANKVRSILTALGIIFGVAAVITMLAIGKGAQAEILNQIKLVGVNNIVIKPIIEQIEEDISESDAKGESVKFSKGLDLKDVQSIQRVLPTVSQISPEIIIDTYVINNGKRRSAKLIGIETSYFGISNIAVDKGKSFTTWQMENAEPVCIIGSGLKKKFFTGTSALGKKIKCGKQWLTIIGVTGEKSVSKKAQDNLGIRDYNMDIYTPIRTILVRYKNRSKLQADLGGNDDDDDNEESKKAAVLPFNYNQIDRMVVQVDESEYLGSTAQVVSKLLKRTHNNQVDFEISIPQQLLEQQQKTKDIFNYVLIAIAAISLLVGGIGIMNIMLASVLERTKEIGTRLAIGAKKEDIISQFLFEALLISLSGGLIGILLGILGSYLISMFSDIVTQVSPMSILVSFGVASLTGIVFGISPAKRAAEQNPVESLRYE